MNLALNLGVTNQLIKLPEPKAFFDAGRTSLKQETQSDPSPFVTNTKSPYPIVQELYVGGTDTFMIHYAPELEPGKTILSSFKTMVDCHSYHLVERTLIPAKHI